MPSPTYGKSWRAPQLLIVHLFCRAQRRLAANACACSFARSIVPSLPIVKREQVLRWHQGAGVLLVIATKSAALEKR